jgi:hypothetical protein
VHSRTATAALAAVMLLALAGTASSAIFELVFTCKPGEPVPPDKKCMSVHVVDGRITVTTNTGQTISLPAGTTTNFSSSGSYTQTAATGTILNFASTGSTTTASLGGGGGGGGGGGTVGSLGSNGGSNGGQTDTNSNSNGTPTNNSGLGTLTTSSGNAGNSTTTGTP